VVDVAVGMMHSAHCRYCATLRIDEDADVCANEVRTVQPARNRIKALYSKGGWRMSQRCSKERKNKANGVPYLEEEKSWHSFSTTTR
jgi:hypothetical protein